MSLRPKKAHVAMSILGVKGHRVGVKFRQSIRLCICHYREIDSKADMQVRVKLYPYTKRGIVLAMLK